MKRHSTALRERLRSSGVALLFCALLPTDVVRADERASVPPPLAQTEARKRVQSLFAKEFSSRQREKRVELAGKLVRLAEDPSQDAVTRYVLLDEARALATKLGDVSTMMAAVDAVVAGFRVNSSTLYLEALEATSRSVRKSRDGSRTLAILACRLTRDSLLRDD